MKTLYRALPVLAIVILFGIFFFAESGSLGARQNSTQASDAPTTSSAPSVETIPDGPLGDSIRLGLQIFSDTPKYAARYVGNKMSCGHCHLKGGTVPYAIPLVGVPGMFPMYRDREKTVVTFEERIEQCFQRSENGHRVPNDSHEMAGLVAYTQWLSQGQVTGRSFPGRGLAKLPELSGDVDRGSQVYDKQCALCHGAEGAGQPPAIPALWGADAYSDGAGMNEIGKIAAFVQQNMPQSNPGSLTPQQAYDVAAFVHSKPHQRFDIKEHK